jgi:branched-chain amino acid transport system substrate-binding protein
MAIQQCVSPGSSQAIPGGYNGVKQITQISTNPNDPEVKLFNAVMKTYSPSTQIVDVTAGAYATVLAFARAMSGLTGDITPATVQAAFASMSPQPYPLGDGITFQCNGKQVSFAPAACSTGGLVGTLDSSGNPKGPYQNINTASVLHLG